MWNWGRQRALIAATVVGLGLASAASADAAPGQLDTSFGSGVS
jgi:hypothetical protein